MSLMDPLYFANVRSRELNQVEKSVLKYDDGSDDSQCYFHLFYRMLSTSDLPLGGHQAINFAPENILWEAYSSKNILDIL